MTDQIHFIGNYSLIIIAVSGLFVGFVLGLQGYYTLNKYGAEQSLGLLVALSLHCANALPDIASDRAAGRMSFPVLLGVRRSRVVAVAGLAGAGVLALSLFRPLGQSGPWVPASAGLLALILLVVAFARLERPFPLMAVGTAVFAVSWLATLPVR